MQIGFSEFRVTGNPVPYGPDEPSIGKRLIEHLRVTGQTIPDSIGVTECEIIQPPPEVELGPNETWRRVRYIINGTE